MNKETLGAISRVESLCNSILDEQRRADEERSEATVKKILIRAEILREQHKQREMLLTILCTLIAIAVILIVVLVVSLKGKTTQNITIEQPQVVQVISPEVEKPALRLDPPVKLPDNVVVAPTPELQKFSTDEYFTPEEFKILNTEIDGWVLEPQYQKMFYDASLKYGLNYLWLVSMAYCEQSFNNPRAINVNADSLDIGITQFNTKNTDIIEKVTKCKDIDVLYNPWACVRCSCYLVNRNRVYYEGVDNYYDEFIMYNGGYGALQKYKDGTSPNHPSIAYADKGVEIMELLINEYYEE